MRKTPGIMRGQGYPRRRRQRGGRRTFGNTMSAAWGRARGMAGRAVRGISGAVLGEARNIAADALRPGSTRGKILLNAKRRVTKQLMGPVKRRMGRRKRRMIGGCVGCGGTCGGRGKQGCV